MIRYISTLLIVLFPLISYGLTYPGSYLLKDSFYLNVTGNYESGHSVINTDNISLTFMVTGNAYRKTVNPMIKFSKGRINIPFWY